MPVEVRRSGDLYLVSSGDSGRLIDAESGWTGPRGSVESILAHCNAYDPWKAVPAGHVLPDSVAAALARFPAR